MVHKTTKLVILLAICFAFIFPFQTVLAVEDRLTVSTEIGFDNKIKRQQGFPIAVTITNEGPDISGELVISVSPGWNANVGNIITSVDIPANSEKTVWLSLPGHSDAQYYGNQQNVQHIRFYEGGWQEGKEVKVGGKTKIAPRMYNEEDVLVGLFTDQPDAFNFLKTVKRQQYGNSFTTIPIDPARVPTEPIGLGMFEFILIDQYSLTELSNEQQEAIKSWISSGGKLIVGGDLGVQQKLGQLSSLLPMEQDIKSVTASTEFFNKKDGREYPTETIELITGTLADSAQISKKTENGDPVVTSRPYGRGEVLQLSFSPSAQTFASWDGAGAYWSDAVQPTLQNSTMYYDSIYDRLAWGIANTTSLFPSSFLPFSVLVIVFLVYVILIFPTIYFILRKVDKREHSWWILPTISILICLGIFGFGGKDRIAQPQMNEVTILQLDEQGLGQGYGSIALLSNRSGNYTINVSTGSFSPFPISNNHSMNRYEGNAGIRNQGDQVDILLKDVEYWSIRNVAGPISALEVGGFEVDLKVIDKKVTGTLKNQTQLSFSEMLLWSGRQEVSLGSVGPGETIDISFELNGSRLTTPTWRNNYSQSSNILERRREDLLRSLQEFNMFERGKPAIVGLSGDELLQASLENKAALVDRLNIIVQSIDVKDAFGGTFALNTDDLTPYAYMVEGQGYLDTMELERGGRSVYASAGTFEFGFTVPEELVGEKTTYSELGIKVRIPESFNYEIYNHEDETYEALNASNTFEQPKKYVSEFGHIMIRVQKSEMPDQLPVPEVTLKGETKR
ncbi:hypothetical protein H1D32_01215 [Anaerobacillus sp. CMMVII]|uniref:hypothetical protein n=1 Tax=Anaerobacillus sp. CMMVII TaxID=2755588 RepID=UPI0021B760AF|nr:hypothetical protein [Anaerobacillus sp. CMMVII]MCT8136501.1 hypothetical protein [Anaerobacillus sp. CMMVII]